MARNHTDKGVRVSWKIVPAVTEVWYPHPAHSLRLRTGHAFPDPQWAQRKPVGQRSRAKYARHASSVLKFASNSVRLRGYSSTISAHYILGLPESSGYPPALILHPGYAEYMRGTGMFLPGNPGGHVFTLLFGGMRNRSLAHRLAIGSLALVLLLAGIGLRAYTLGHISRSADAANMEVISVYPMTPDAMQHVVAMALADSRVEAELHSNP